MRCTFTIAWDISRETAPVAPRPVGHPALSPCMAVIERERPAAAPIDAGCKATQLRVEDLVVAPRGGFSVAEHFFGQFDAFGHALDPSCIRHEAWFRRTIKSSMRTRVAGRQRVAERSPLLRHPMFLWRSGAGRTGGQPRASRMKQESWPKKPLSGRNHPTRPVQIYEYPRISGGGVGAMPDATPALPTNARQSLPIRLFAGVCRFGVNFGPGPRSLALRHSPLINVENPIKQGVAQ